MDDEIEGISSDSVFHFDLAHCRDDDIARTISNLVMTCNEVNCLWIYDNNAVKCNDDNRILIACLKHLALVSDLCLESIDKIEFFGNLYIDIKEAQVIAKIMRQFTSSPLILKKLKFDSVHLSTKAIECLNLFPEIEYNDCKWDDAKITSTIGMPARLYSYGVGYGDVQLEMIDIHIPLPRAKQIVQTCQALAAATKIGIHYIEFCRASISLQALGYLLTATLSLSLHLDPITFTKNSTLPPPIPRFGFSDCTLHGEANKKEVPNNEDNNNNSLGPLLGSIRFCSDFGEHIIDNMNIGIKEAKILFQLLQQASVASPQSFRLLFRKTKIVLDALIYLLPSSDFIFQTSLSKITFENCTFYKEKPINNNAYPEIPYMKWEDCGRTMEIGKHENFSQNNTRQQEHEQPDVIGVILNLIANYSPFQNIVTKLDFNKHINSLEWQSIATFFKQQSENTNNNHHHYIRHLNLSGCGVSDIDMLITSLERQTIDSTLHHLDLSLNPNIKAGSIVKLLTKSKIHHLVLESNEMTEGDMKAIAISLQYTDHLQSLNVKHNRNITWMGDKKYIIDILRNKNMTLKYLHMDAESLFYSEGRDIEFYLELNRKGRKEILKNINCISNLLMPLIFEKFNGKSSLLYWLIQTLPYIFSQENKMI